MRMSIMHIIAISIAVKRTMPVFLLDFCPIIYEPLPLVNPLICFFVKSAPLLEKGALPLPLALVPFAAVKNVIVQITDRLARRFRPGKKLLFHGVLLVFLR